MKIRILVLLSAFLLTSCSWGTFDRREKYLDATTLEPVKIPEGLDTPPFEDVLPIPPVTDLRNLSGKKLEVELPEALSTNFGVDMIVIKRLGEARWVFVDASPALVWPRIRQFWEDNRMPLEMADPGRGLMESGWLVAGNNLDNKQLYESLTSGVPWADGGGTTRHKFRVRVEAGVRPGSTEVYVEHRSLPVAGPVREDVVDWSGVSDNNELEGEVLNGIAFYLGDRINTARVISQMATQIGGQKAELVPDRLKPVLKYRLSFDRAWATVGNALESARISVEDLDRTAANYYVYYDETGAGQPGFFGRMFSDEKDTKTVAGAANRYLVHLDEKNDEVHVVVMKDGSTLANALVAEKLLKIIKQFST